MGLSPSAADYYLAADSSQGSEPQKVADLARLVGELQLADEMPHADLSLVADSVLLADSALLAESPWVRGCASADPGAHELGKVGVRDCAQRVV